MAYAYSRGHKIIYKNKNWIYEDDKMSVREERACKRCDEKPTPEGYDACLGFIESCYSACCGHGVTELILIDASTKHV